MPHVLVARVFASLGLMLLDDGLQDLLLNPCVEQFRLTSSAPAFDRSLHRLRRQASASVPVPVQMCFAFSWMTVVVSLMSCPHYEDQPTLRPLQEPCRCKAVQTGIQAQMLELCARSWLPV